MSKPANEDKSKALKIIMIGMSGVGKTSFITRFADNKFSDNQYVASIGVDFRVKSLTIDEENIMVQMWDTAGQERFRSICNAYYRNANGLIFAMDPSQPDSLQTIARLLQESTLQCTNQISKILITTKHDLGINSWLTDMDAIEQFAEKNDMAMFKTSAKTGENVELAVESLVKSIKQKTEMKQQAPLNQELKEKSKKQTESCLC